MESSLLNIVKSYLIKEIAPKACDIDYKSEALKKALQGLANLNLLALRVPEKFGGYEFSEESFYLYQQLLARYSGALAFLQTQHQSAGNMLVNSSNYVLQQQYLPRMGSGEALLGIGFSQLRRQGEPLTRAIPVLGGYQLDGVVPWLTGWDIFSEFIVAATLPDGRVVFGIVPIVDTQQASGGKICFSLPASLAAMTSTNTVSATFSKWFLAQELVVCLKPPGWIEENDRNNILKPTSLALGCALAGLDIMEAVYHQKLLPFIKDAYTCLITEVRNCQTIISQIIDRKGSKENPLPMEEMLKLRGWTIDLASRCGQAAVTVSSGAANYIGHPAQRVYRESLVFSVTGQNAKVMEVTLNNLVERVGSEKWQIAKERKITVAANAIYYRKVIHLSHIIDSAIPQWLGDPPVEFETAAEIEKDGYFLRSVSIGEHSATHINAPKSFYPEGLGVDEYLADSLVLPGVVIDISHKVVENPDYTLNIDDITAWELENGAIMSGSIVLLNSGWQEKWVVGNGQNFFNQDTQGVMHFPGFSKDSVEFLMSDRAITALGIDTHGVDGGMDNNFTINRLILGKQGIILENLANLDKLPAKGATIIIGLMRLKNGSGSPVGVLAFLP
jgi:kynurenine formamidase